MDGTLTHEDTSEWVETTLGEVISGSGLTKSELTTIGVPAVHYGQIHMKYKDGIVTDTISYTSTKNAETLKKVNHGDIILAKTSENMDDVCTAVAYMGKPEIVTGSHTFIIKNHGQNPIFLMHYYNGSGQFDSDKRRISRGSKVIETSITEFRNLTYKFPPLPIQTRIVAKIDQLFSHLDRLETV